MLKSIGQFTKLFEAAEALAKELKLSIKTRTDFDRQAVLKYYFGVYKEMITYFIEDLESRIGTNEDAYSKLQQFIEAPTEDGAKTIASNYAEILNENEDEVLIKLKGEINVYREKISNIPQITLKDLVKEWEFLPTMKSLILYFMSIPASVASAERSFSALKRVKTWLRSTMGQDRLCGLISMQLNREFLPSEEEIIEKFVAKSRKHDFIL